MSDEPMPSEPTTPPTAAEPAPDVVAVVPAAPVEPPAPDGPGADPALLAASEAAAAEREATAAAVALVLASAKAKAEATAAEAAASVPPSDPSLTDGDQFRRRSRRAAIRGLVGMLARGIAVLALFIGGIALGAAAFQRSDQAAAAAAPIVDPAVDGAQPPVIVQEFVAALAGGDADSVRSALQAEPHARLTGELRRFDIQSISSVETLGTHVDGPRSATEVVMQGTTTTGAPISLNLIILTDGNTIEGFR